MDQKEALTNEKLGKKFKSQFELVNYAIRLAENMIKTGRDPRVKTEINNRAMQIIDEIVHNRDKFDDIPVEVLEENRYEERGYNGSRRVQDEAIPKHVEKKKGRKILAD